MSQEKTHNFVANHDEDMKDVKKTITNTAAVFRFKFTDDIVASITEFAKIHQYDTRQSYKEAWVEWVDENDDIIYKEKERLTNLGYKGDVEDKMYKAGRYYFRNKKSQVDTEKKQRRKYIPTSREMIDAMDAHISEGISRGNFTPADGFDHFCENYRQILADEIVKTLQIVQLDTEEMSKKIKKTYKNRYFCISRKTVN